MSYQFDLKGSQLFLLLAGLVFVAGMLFLLGMLIGTGSTEPAPQQTPTLDQAVDDERQDDAKLADTVSPGETPADPSASPRSGNTGLVPAASDEQSRKRIYELQLSAHLSEEATQRVIDDLSASNLQPYVVEARDSRDRALYTVRLGPWDSMAEAAEAARNFRDYSELDAYDPVVRHRPEPLAAGGRDIPG